MIDINKKYRTRGGREVRIYSVDANNLDTVHGAHLRKDGQWMVASWGMDGQWMVASWGMDGARCGYEETSMDLVEVKPRIQRTLWVNLFPHTTAMFSHKLDADVYASSARLACVKVEIDCEEGEGL